jgi:serine O-acetyltransferase
MKINSKAELRFVLMADLMMNRGVSCRSIKSRVREFFIPDYIMDYLRCMRHVSFYSCRKGLYNKVMYIIYAMRYRRLGIKLGFSIGCDCFGYGLVIPHYGTIVVGDSNRIGNYAVLHTSTCISGNGKTIGDALYLSTGVKMTSKLILGSNVSVGANSVVNKSFDEDNIMIAGAPAKVVKPSPAWYIRDGVEFSNKVDFIEKIKQAYLDGTKNKL